MRTIGSISSRSVIAQEHPFEYSRRTPAKAIRRSLTAAVRSTAENEPPSALRWNRIDTVARS
jgi:hypothetical protein